MSTEAETIRDFVYLDWERVRSLAAQLLQGVPEDSSTEKTREVQLHAEVEGGLPLVLQSKGGGDYRYFRTDNETRSFHHYVYTLVEDRLGHEGFLKTVGPSLDPAQWTPRFFTDGQFVLVSGTIRFMDYPWMCAMLESLPKMMISIQHYNNMSLEQQQKSGLITQRQVEAQKRQQQEQVKEIKALKIPDLTAIIRQIYGDIVRVKILPSAQHPSNFLVGTANIHYFQDPASTLSQRHGFEAQGTWKALIQINLSSDEKPTPLPIGNPVEDSIEGIAFGLDNIVRTVFSPRFPAVSFTPVSIYRLCGRPRAESSNL